MPEYRGEGCERCALRCVEVVMLNVDGTRDGGESIVGKVRYSTTACLRGS